MEKTLKTAENAQIVSWSEIILFPSTQLILYQGNQWCQWIKLCLILKVSPMCGLLFIMKKFDLIW